MVRFILGVFLVGILLSSVAEAVETNIIVRAKARGAKFIGTSMGGAIVVIKDSVTGDIIREGLILGGTGSTKRIMQKALRPNDVLSDPSTAKFETSVDLNEPRQVTIEVYAPGAQDQSTVKTSTQIWLIPGKDISGNGDGLIIEVPGFSVDVMTPQAHEKVRLHEGKVVIPIKANVVMMCGCPIKPEGLWNSNSYEVEALVKHNGKAFRKLPLTYANKISTFSAQLKVQEEGIYDILVYAYDPETGNTGVDKTTFIVSK